MSPFFRCVTVQAESPNTYSSISQMTLIHWSGRRNRIKRTTLLPSCSQFRKQICDTIPLGRYGLRHTFCGRKSKWLFFELWHYGFNTLCRYFLLKHINEGKIAGRTEVRGRRGRWPKQLLDNLKGLQEMGKWSTRSPSIGYLLWKWLWTCYKTD